VNTIAAAVRARRIPALGGFNLTFFYLETRRLLRNRRTVLLTLVVPVALVLLFTNNKRFGEAAGAKVAASTLVGIAVYAAMLAATSGGAMVSVERALGWSRQLRLTPLRPVAYVVLKVLIAMLLGLVSVAAVLIAGALTGVQMSAGTWALSGLLAWVSSFIFASFGLFMGYLLPSENVMQLIGPVLAVFALFGGLFVPVSLLPSTIQDVAPYMPTYGVAEIARFPLAGGTFDPTWILGAVVWTIAFGAAATLLFRRDTRRT
jgi:ABC-2 type transport system permease protein